MRSINTKAQHSYSIPFICMRMHCKNRGADSHRIESNSLRCALRAIAAEIRRNTPTQKENIPVIYWPFTRARAASIPTHNACVD